ncbi:MAG: EAL domain-containing protein [Cloacibacillus sp.]
MKKRAGFRLVFLLVFTIIFAFAGCVSANASRVVRVGYYVVDGLQGVDGRGRYTGYTYEYLQAIAQYTGWKYEFIRAPFAELEKMLVRGEIDILPTLTRTPERELKYDFTTQQAGVGGTRLIVPGGNTTLAYEDFGAFDGLAIGDIRGMDNARTPRQRQFEEYAARNGFSAHIVKFATPKAMLAALDAGRIDAAITSASRSINGYRVIADFAITPFFFGVTKGNKTIRDGLDYAISQIKLYEPFFDKRLAIHYFGGAGGHSPVFSKRELEYIKTHRTIRAVYDAAWQPIEFRDEETGQYAGIMSDILKNVSRTTGMKFEFVPGNGFEEASDIYQNGDVQMMTAINHDFGWAGEQGANISQTVLESPVVMVISPSFSDAEYTAALPKGYYVTKKYMERHPQTNAVYFETIRECLDAVLTGEARFTVANFYVAEYFLLQERYRTLDFRNMAGITENVSVAVSKEAGPTLLSIINKSLESLPQDDLSKIINANTVNKARFSPVEFLYAHPGQSAMALLCLLILGGAFFIRLTISRNRYRDTLTAVKKQGEVIRLMTESMAAGLSVREADEKLTLKYTSDNLCQLLGYSAEEFAREAHGFFASLIPADEAGPLYSRIRAALERGCEYQEQYRVRKKDGSFIWVQDTGRKFVDTDGAVRINSVITDISPLKNAMEELRALAEYDTVTPVFNRHTFFARTREMLDADPSGKYAIICWDIARFKVFNDIYGMAGGNGLLRAIGKDTNDALRGRGLCGRLYADNFVLCVPLELLDAEHLAQKMTDGLSRYGYDFEFVPNIGIYVIDDRTVPVELMCDRAGIAQRSVKGGYEKICAFYDDRFRDHLLYEQEIINDMRPALNNGQFELWLQPQYNLTTGAIVGAEALVRWLHPRKGYLLPNAFIPLFEKNGFITQLDLYMFEGACRLLRKWEDEGYTNVPVALNLSRIDIYNTNLVSTLVALVQKYRLRPELLKLEITESAYMEDPEQIISIAKELQAHGFKVEMDDFGSGYSSLNALKDMPVDLLKLDMKFIADSGDTERGGNILNSVVRMTKWLDLPVLAEGVETQEQADYLKSIGCLLAQGYLYSKPLPVDEFRALLSESATEEHPAPQKSKGAPLANKFWDPKAQHTLIFNSIMDAAAIFEYHDGILEPLQTNEKFFNVIGGMTRDEFLKYSKDVTPLLFSDDRGPFRAAVEKAATEDEETEALARWSRNEAGGCYVWLRIRLRLLAKSMDRYVLFAAIENVTEQKALETALYESEETLRAAFTLTNMNIWQYFPKERVAREFGKMQPGFHNPKVLTNYPESWLDLDITHPDDAEQFIAMHKAIADGAQTASCTIRLKYDDGLYYWETLRLTAVYDINGKFIKAVGTDEKVAPPGETRRAADADGAKDGDAQ